ncbi:MerR family transcriptional regulator [Effusibacillus lacus]|uniref:MerR family transcriptional regulator n=1 Tax=Effusibacillus lacus TaxID=1348429 RepID=A0A292YSM5_9BACL|nr:MerR family transcriptional regulator [Effusibacillus lacus]TCS75834.1 MerR family glutamine synthetase transcriptional repressor [Effusibacillus lacus]GAX91773.1 MerR family transcriptional regulator [Effusibacillus lacus]
MSDELRRNLALFPIGIVQKLTELTPRQIRYYEQHQLIQPARTAGNQRLFSFNDVERLLEIKKLIDQGLNMAGIKKMMGDQAVPTELPVTEKAQEEAQKVKDLTDQELHDLLKKELILRGRPGMPGSLIQGELSRFFH